VGGDAVLAGEEPDRGDLSRQSRLRRQQQGRAEAPPLPVGRDGDPANLGRRVIDPGYAQAGDQPAILPDSERRVRGIGQLRREFGERLGERGHLQIVMELRFGHVGSPLQREDLARIRDCEPQRFEL
jgi:hypothetical protein